METQKLHVVIAAVAAALSAPMATATSPTPVAWSYPTLDDLCLLEAAAAADGVQAAYPIGTVVATKHGKWICAKAIARQSPVATAGAWMEDGAK